MRYTRMWLKPVGMACVGRGRSNHLESGRNAQGKSARCKLIQLDLHLRSGDVRIRFDDTAALWRFCAALDDLLTDIVAPDPLDYSPVRTRVYTDADDGLEPQEHFAAQLKLS